MDNIIKSLSTSRAELALKWALEANTELRRDDLLCDLVETLVQQPVCNIDLNFIERLFDQITHQHKKDATLLNVIKELSTKSEDLSILFPQILRFEAGIEKIVDEEVKCATYCFFYRLLMTVDKDRYKSIISSILQNLRRVWEVFDRGWRKINTGFQIAEMLAGISPEIAREYISLSERYRDEMGIDAYSNASIYSLCISLAIQAFSGLLLKNIYTETDFSKIAELIARIPSNAGRSELWTELALRLYANKKLFECKNIVNSYLKPLLENMPDGNTGQKIIS